MLVQDRLTGYLHEVPDGQLYEGYFAEAPEQFAEGQVVYDGFGNPVGIAPALIGPLVGTAAGRQLTRTAGGLLFRAAGGHPYVKAARSLVGSLFGRRKRHRFPPGTVPPPPSWPAPPQPMPTMAPPHPSFRPHGQPGVIRPPWPRGWIRRPLPYTGLGPKRLYMRCAVWPGPRGLVPAHAAQMPAVQAQMPPAPAAAAAAAAGRRRRRGRRR